MTGSLAGLLVANALYLVIGVALLPLLRVARTRAELAGRLGLGYMRRRRRDGRAVGAPRADRRPRRDHGARRRRARRSAPWRCGASAAPRGRRVTRCHLAREARRRVSRHRRCVFRARARCGGARDARVLGAAARRVGRLGDLGDEGTRAVRLRRRRSRRLHDAAVRTAAASACCCPRSKRPASARWAPSTERSSTSSWRCSPSASRWDYGRCCASACRLRSPARRSSRSSRPTPRCASWPGTWPTSRWRSSSRLASSRSPARCSTSSSGLLPVAAIMLGAATLTKPEGLLFAAAALIPFVLIARTRASLLTAPRRRADPAAVADLRRRARAQESRVQLRRRAEPRLPLRPLRSRGPSVLGCLAPGLVERLGVARAVRARRLRRSLARHCAGVSQRLRPPGRYSRSRASCSSSGSRSSRSS